MARRRRAGIRGGDGPGWRGGGGLGYGAETGRDGAGGEAEAAREERRRRAGMARRRRLVIRGREWPGWRGRGCLGYGMGTVLNGEMEAGKGGGG